jgi:dihydroxy-acid dehydratase
MAPAGPRPGHAARHRPDRRGSRRPLIGVANTWIEIGPCNYHLRELAVHVKDGIREAGGTPLEFNTVSISDGITMGSEGMRTSLVSREIIADSIELVARGNMFDGLVVLVGCDKTIPAAVMALARLDIPGCPLRRIDRPGPLARQGRHHQDVFEAVGAHSAGKLSSQDLDSLERQACPGAGACGGQFTANTMATVCECIGLSPFGSASVPGGRSGQIGRGPRRRRDGDGRAAARLRPRQIITKQSLENAIAAVAATGGSTNAVLHLLAIANEAGVPLTIDDFNQVNARVPLLADLKPGGKYVATDLYRAGGIPLVAKRLLDGGHLHAGCDHHLRPHHRRACA